MVKSSAEPASGTGQGERRRPTLRPLLFLAFGAVALLFILSTVLANWLSYEIEPRYESVASNALPSIVRLTAASDALRDLEATSREYLDVEDEERDAARKAMDEKWRAVDAELAAYLDLPAYPGERELFEAGVRVGLRDVNAALVHLVADVDDHRADAAKAAVDGELRAATNRTAGLLRNMVSFNAMYAQEEMNRIAAIHRSASRRALLLDVLAFSCAAMVAIAVARRSRAHDQLLADHNALLEVRAKELEIFGQRVAHDLLSPLSALTFCLGLFKKASEDDPKLQEALIRARACVSRAQTMVRGIFDFARSGGTPEPGARADVREALDQVLEDVRTTDAGAGVGVTVEPFETCQVACDPGVLQSMLSNLVRNAIKYMSDSALKEITIRVRRRVSSVYVAVEDTGPGVPIGLEALIFEPYFRAEGVTQPGIGLGLATVKRLCEGHGGKVGARSKLGQGSLFWFVLPTASKATAGPSAGDPSAVSHQVN